MRTYLKRALIALGFVGTAVVGGAVADVAITAGSGTTIFAFTCFTTKVCPAAVTVNSAGTEIGTAAAPIQVSVANTGANGTAVLTTGTGGTFPATQSGTWTVQPGNTANTTPWLTSISQGGNTATVAAAGADALTNSTIGVNTYSNNRLFNGSTWDRAPGNTFGAYAIPGLSTATGTGWTSATGGNSTQALMSTASGAAALVVQLVQGSTISGGAVTFECTYDAVPNWVSLPVSQVLNPQTFAPLTNPYTLVQSTNQPFLILTQGCQQVRIRLSTVITGSGTVTPYTALLPYNPTLGALLNPLAAGSAVIGKVGIDQTTPGTTNATQPIGGASGGNSTTGNIVANNTTAVVIKASAGTLYGAQVYGIGSAPAYLKIYNATSATCGSGTPVKRLMIPAAATAANGAGSNITFGDIGIAFGTGITYCVTTGIGDADTTAPAASTYLVNLDWK